MHGLTTPKFTTRNVKGKLRGNNADIMTKKQKNVQEKVRQTNASERDKYKGYTDKHNMAFLYV